MAPPHYARQDPGAAMAGKPDVGPIAAIVGAFLLSFTSSFGQTFFIGLFGAEIRGELALTEGGFGSLYSLATLASAAVMIWVGGAIDRVSARAYAIVSFLGLAAAAGGMAVVPGAIVLALVLFGLRLTGQGMMSHASTIVAARTGERTRGRAMSVAVAGHPAGEAALPALAVAAIAWLGWRDVWLSVAVLMLVCAVAVPALLPRLSPRRQAERSGGSDAHSVGISRWTIVRDRRFLGVLLATIAPPAIGTGMVFHQTSIAAANGWPLSLMAAGFVGYALGSVVAGFTMGWLIDRLNARILFGWHLAPLIAATTLLAVSDDPVIAFVLLGGLGLTAGSSAIVTTALYIGFYGTGAIGVVRALATAIMIFSTALSPGIFGLLADIGVGWSAIAWLSTGFAVLSLAIARLTLARGGPAP